MMEYPYEYKDGGLYWTLPGPARTVGKRCGCINNNGYRRVQANGVRKQEHVLIWEMFNGSVPEGHELDHINRDRTDNRIENLRAVTRSQNQFNRGASGVYLNKSSGRWRAAIKVDKVRRHLGTFDTKEEAETAYQRAKEKLHVFGN